jgi:hypothetical protein
MTEHRVKVLIIDEDAAFLEEAATELSGTFTVYTSATGGNGLKVFADLRPQVVIVDAGISDIPFPSLLEDLKGLDRAVLRIATSHDYSVIEKVVQAIDTVHIHKYFRKPVNYFDLIEVINARTVSYQVGRGIPQDADISPAYERLHRIVDKAKEVEKLGQQLELQMAKIRDVEAESFSKVKDAVGEVHTLRKKVADKEAVISGLQAKSLELEELKKRDIDRVERERAALRQELKGVQDENNKLLREKDELSHIQLDNEALSREIGKLREENGDLRISVPREREAMLEEMTRERRTLEEELARKKEEAERVVEAQKERNKAELQALHDAFEEEKQHAGREIERLKAELEENRKARLAEIERERKRAEADLEEFRRQQVAEKAAIEQSMEKEKQRAAQEIRRLRAEFEEDRKAKLAEIEAERKRVEAKLAEIEAERKRAEEELARKREEAERVVEVQKERNKAELQKLHDAFEEEKQHAGREIEKLKAELEEDRNARLAAIAADRKRVEEEQAAIEADRKRVEAKLAEIEAERKGWRKNWRGKRRRPSGASNCKRSGTRPSCKRCRQPLRKSRSVPPGFRLSSSKQSLRRTARRSWPRSKSIANGGSRNLPESGPG